MIASTDLDGVDQQLALRILAVARSIAPCLDTLEGDDRASAIAVLVGVAGEARGRGSRMVKSQRIGPASVDFTAAESWFSDDDRSALRHLCASAAPTSTAGPIGHFPRAGRIDRLWPERYDD